MDPSPISTDGDDLREMGARLTQDKGYYARALPSRYWILGYLDIYILCIGGLPFLNCKNRTSVVCLKQYGQ